MSLRRTRDELKSARDGLGDTREELESVRDELKRTRNGVNHFNDDCGECRLQFEHALKEIEILKGEKEDLWKEKEVNAEGKEIVEQLAAVAEFEKVGLETEVVRLRRVLDDERLRREAEADVEKVGLEREAARLRREAEEDEGRGHGLEEGWQC